MQFFRRNQFLLCFVGVLLLASVLVVRQVIANQSAHVEMREDFVLLYERQQTRPAERLYQMLIQQLPVENERSLLDDLQRMALIIDVKIPNSENLLWKYYTSVKNELQHRSE